MTNQPAATNPPPAPADVQDLVLKQLQRIANAAEVQARYNRVLASAIAAPNYRRPIHEYGPNFDYAALGIKVVSVDGRKLATVIEWNNHRFTRRIGGKKFGKAVWFSRPTGRGDDDGDSATWERVLTFKNYSEAEDLPENFDKDK